MVDLGFKRARETNPICDSIFACIKADLEDAVNGRGYPEDVLNRLQGSCKKISSTMAFKGNVVALQNLFHNLGNVACQKKLLLLYD